MKLLRRLCYWINRRKIRSELEEEIEFHRTMKRDALEEKGLAPELSYAAANRSMGNVTIALEDARHVWVGHWLDHVTQDIRYSLRLLQNNPVFTLIAILSLAIGIGANTALFSLIDAALLKKLPVKAPDELVLFEWSSGGKWPAAGIAGNVKRDPATNSVSSTSFSYETFRQFRSNSRTLSDVFAFAPANVNVTIDAYSESVKGQLVSGNYFSALGISAVLGRTIADSDDRPSAEPVTVISHRYWQRRFASDPAVIGKAVQVGGVSMSIIGVTSPGFNGTLGFGNSTDLSIPLSVERHALRGGVQGSLLDTPWTWWTVIMGRVKTGTDTRNVQAELERVFQSSALETYEQFLQRMPPNSVFVKQRPDTPHLRALTGGRGMTNAVADSTPLFFTLISIFALLFLLVAVNVASLMLARSATRQREITIRLALGAGRLRIVRQVLTESALLALLAGLVGVIAAYWAKDLLAAVLPQNKFTFIDLTVDHRVLAFNLATSLLTGILFGLAPALNAARSDVHVSMKETARALHEGRSWFGKSLVVLQVSALIVLLIGAGLFLGTLHNLQNVNLGFNTKNLLMFEIKHQELKYDDAQASRLYDQLLEKIRNVPGVVSVTTTASYVPIVATNANILGNARLMDAGLRTNTGWVYQFSVGPDFFKTVGIPVLRGRDFNSGDNGHAPKVAIINESLARQSFPTTEAIGKQFHWVNNQTFQIIGVVKDVKHELRAVVPAFYLLAAQIGLPYSVSIDIRTALDPSSVVPTVREIVRDIDPNIPRPSFKTLDETIADGLAAERLLARASTAFGGVTLLLAMIGLYGLMSYGVAHRSGEIGIRMALGAQRKGVVWLVLHETLFLVLLGSLIGLFASLGLTRLITSMLFGLEPADLQVMSLAVILMLGVATLAGYLPARRASRIDPTIALRHE